MKSMPKAKVIWYEVAVLSTGLGTIVLVSRLCTPLGAVLLSIGVVMLTAPLAWRFLRFFWRLGAEIGSELRVASTSVPTPAEIALRLARMFR